MVILRVHLLHRMSPRREEDNPVEALILPKADTVSPITGIGLAAINLSNGDLAAPKCHSARDLSQSKTGLFSSHTPHLSGHLDRSCCLLLGSKIRHAIRWVQHLPDQSDSRPQFKSPEPISNHTRQLVGSGRKGGHPEPIQASESGALGFPFAPMHFTWFFGQFVVGAHARHRQLSSPGKMRASNAPDEIAK